MGLFKGKSKEDGPAATDQATTLADEEETQNQEKNDDEYAETVVEQEISSKVRQSYNGAPAVAPAGIDDSKTRQILQKVDEATLVMEMNIAAAAERGENLDDLQVKTSAVAESSKQFQKNTKTVKNKLWYKNIRRSIIITAITIVVLALVGVAVWQSFRPTGY